MFASMRLTPFSQALAGGVLRWNVWFLFAAAGALMFGLALYLLLQGVSGGMIEQLPNGQSE